MSFTSSSSQRAPQDVDWASLERAVGDSAPLPRRAERRVAREGRLRLVADATTLMLVLVLAALTGWAAEPTGGLKWLVVSGVAVLASFGMAHSYRPAPRLSLSAELRTALVAPPLIVLALGGVRLAVTGDELPASSLVVGWLLLSGAVVASRAATRRLLSRPLLGVRLSQRALVIGAGDVGRRVARRLQESPTAGLEPIGYLDKDPRPAGAGDLPVLGASWDLERVISEHDVHAVVVSFSTAPHHVLLRIVRRCQAMGVTVLVVPRLFEVEGSRTAVHHFGALPLVTLAPSDPRGWAFRLKYALDRLLAGVFLLALAPLLAAIALAVLVTSGRPILFRQRRVGYGDQVFEMLKFRTMRESPQAGGEANAAWAASVLGAEPRPGGAGSDDRRTPMGAFLRKHSLDELPQLLNVLRGDMSLVGPRPELPGHVEHFDGAVYRYADRHRVRSGISGWAQVSGLRGETSLADRVEWDNHYIENWSFGLDAKIALRSLQAVLGHRNAR